jgi:hypothetical protein
VWPNNVFTCSCCGETVCAGCEPSCGRCGNCKGLLCYACFHTAKSFHRGWCETCAIPRKPDDDLVPKAPSDAAYWSRKNGRKVKL